MLDLYMAVVFIAIFVLLITAADVITNRIASRKNKIHIIAVCLLTGAAVLCEWIGVKTNGGAASLIWLHRLVKLTEFCIVPVIAAAAAAAYGEAANPKIAGGVLAAHTVFEILALINNWVFSVDADNIYHREKLYWIYIAAFCGFTIYCFVCIVRLGKKHQARFGSVLILILCFLAVGIGIQIIYSEIRIDYMCVAIGNLLLYNYSGNVVNQVDSVTRLLNRRCYEKNIENIKSPAYILIFDINNFKGINDTYGHIWGDRCLAIVAQKIYDIYGKYGLCYRIGGDEFCVIMYKYLSKLEYLNRQFENALNEMRRNNEKMPDVAVGYAYYNQNKTDIKTVIEKADDMMYNSKR